MQSPSDSLLSYFPSLSSFSPVRNSVVVKRSAANPKGGKSGKQSNIAKASRKCLVTRRVERQTNNRIWPAE